MNKVLFFFLLICFSCKKDDNSTVTKNEIKDFDGNVYKTVTIGTQIWLSTDLKATHYLNGDAIANVTDGITWSSLSSGGYCDYDNSPSNSTIYGRLYNWYVVQDSRKICPVGWHSSTDTEREILIEFLGGAEVAGCSLKEQGNSHWVGTNQSTNTSNFTALPGGIRNPNGTFISRGDIAFWWGSYMVSSNSISCWHVDGGYCTAHYYYYAPKAGLSIRCIKD